MGRNLDIYMKLALLSLEYSLNDTGLYARTLDG